MKQLDQRNMEIRVKRTNSQEPLSSFSYNHRATNSIKRNLSKISKHNYLKIHKAMEKLKFTHDSITSEIECINARIRQMFDARLQQESTSLYLLNRNRCSFAERVLFGNGECSVNNDVIEPRECNTSLRIPAKRRKRRSTVSKKLTNNNLSKLVSLDSTTTVRS